MKFKLFINPMVFLLILGLALMDFGCTRLKRISAKPGEEVIQKSYSLPIYGYRSQVIVKTTPQELMERFVSGFLEVEEISRSIQITPKNVSKDLDLTRVGQSIEVDLKLLEFNFPCRVITVKYKPEKELWLLTLTDGTWALLRIELSPVSQGCLLSLNVIGKTSKVLSTLLESFPLIEATAKRLDLILAYLQAEFDPSLNPESLVEKGLRGELFKPFLQVHEASVWVNDSPEDIVHKIIEPENLKKLLDTVKIEDLHECLFQTENRLKWERGSEEPIFCAGKFNIGGFDWDHDSFTIIKPQNFQDFYTIYGVVEGIILFQEKLVGEPELGGTRVRMIINLELPSATTPILMEGLVSISGVPGWMEKMLVELKHIAEGKE